MGVFDNFPTTLVNKMATALLGTLIAYPSQILGMVTLCKGVAALSNCQYTSIIRLVQNKVFTIFEGFTKNWLALSKFCSIQLDNRKRESKCGVAVAAL